MLWGFTGMFADPLLYWQPVLCLTRQTADEFLEALFSFQHSKVYLYDRCPYVRALPGTAFIREPYDRIFSDTARLVDEPILMLPQDLDGIDSSGGISYSVYTEASQLGIECRDPTMQRAAIFRFSLAQLIYARLALTPSAEFGEAIVSYAERAPKAVLTYIKHGGAKFWGPTHTAFRPIPRLNANTLASLLSIPDQAFRIAVTTHLIPKHQPLRKR